MYAAHNYGNPVIGLRSDIEMVPIERLQAFYRTWYQPDNALLTIGGKFDEAAALAEHLFVLWHFKAPRMDPATVTTEDSGSCLVRTPLGKTRSLTWMES